METVDAAASFAEAVDGYAFAKGRDLFGLQGVRIVDYIFSGYLLVFELERVTVFK